MNLNLLSLAILTFALPVTHAVEVRKVDINYRRFHPSARLLEIPGFKAKEAVNLGLDVDLGGPFYWNNEVRSLTDGGGYKYVAWNLMLGVRLFPSLDLEYEHLSGHLLDHPESAYPGGRFPVQDSLGIRWRLLQSDSPTRPIF
jgi:hypothetical protein